MNKDQKISLVYSSIIGALLKTYEAGELNQHGVKLMKKADSHLKKTYMNDKELYFKVINVSNKAWGKAIENYQRMEVEAVSFVIAIYNRGEKQLTKYAKIKPLTIERFARHKNNKINIGNSENNAYMIVDFLIEELNKSLDFGVDTGASRLKQIRKNLENNAILEGKL